MMLFGHILLPAKEQHCRLYRCTLHLDRSIRVMATAIASILYLFYRGQKQPKPYKSHHSNSNHRIPLESKLTADDDSKESSLQLERRDDRRARKVLLLQFEEPRYTTRFVCVSSISDSKAVNLSGRGAKGKPPDQSSCYFVLEVLEDTGGVTIDGVFLEGRIISPPRRSLFTIKISMLRKPTLQSSHWRSP
eukprot:scaffold905_cov223-Alexandrium_tamarense.AAC.13